MVYPNKTPYYMVCAHRIRHYMVYANNIPYYIVCAVNTLVYDACK